MTKIYKKLHLKLRKPLILRASEYLSMREKEKTVSLVFLPTQPQLNPKAIVAASLILSTYVVINIILICYTISIRKYMPDSYVWCIFFKNYFTKKYYTKNHLIGGDEH